MNNLFTIAIDKKTEAFIEVDKSFFQNDFYEAAVDFDKGEYWFLDKKSGRLFRAVCTKFSIDDQSEFKVVSATWDDHLELLKTMVILIADTPHQIPVLYTVNESDKNVFIDAAKQL